MNRLYAFCGKMGSGKDTYGKYLEKILENKGYKVKHYSFATKLKEEINTLIKYFKSDIRIKEVANEMNVSIEEVNQIFLLIKNALNKDDSLNAYSREENIRKSLQYWGTEVRRNQNPDYWVNKTKQAIKDLWNENYIVYLTDARFLNEINAIEELEGTLILLNLDESIRMERLFLRDNFIPSKEALQHSSEIELEQYNFKNIIQTDEIKTQDIEDFLRGFLDI